MRIDTSAADLHYLLQPRYSAYKGELDLIEKQGKAYREQLKKIQENQEAAARAAGRIDTYA